VYAYGGAACRQVEHTGAAMYAYKCSIQKDAALRPPLPPLPCVCVQSSIQARCDMHLGG
jgi:hypothetical protein